MTDKQQASLLEKLAGKRGGQVLAGILDDFSEVERAMSEMNKAAGAADAEMKVVEESIDFKLNAFKQTWVNTLQQIIDRGDLVKTIDLFTKFSEVIGEVVNKLGLFGTIGVGAGIFGGIKVFRNFDSIIKTLNQFSQMGSVVGLAKGGVNTLESVSKIAEAMKDMDEAQKIATVSAMKLNSTQATQILLTAGVKEETIEASIAQGTLATSENATTGSTISLSNAYRGLAASLGISTAALTAFIAAAAGIAIGVSAWIAYQQHIKETAKAAADSARSIREEQDAIDGQITKYKELKDKLNDTKLTEEQQYEIKKQLYELQKSLNETYGDEASKLDLVNGGYESQLALLKEISKEKAQEYLQEHHSDYTEAEKRLNTVSNHDFMPTQAYDERVAQYLKHYNGLIDLNKRGGGGQLAFTIKATDEEAEAVLRQLYNDVEAFGERTGANVGSTLDDIADKIQTFTNDEVFQADKEFVKEFSKQAVLADNELRKVYSDGIDAVEKYNDALLKYDSNADEATKTQAQKAINDAKDNLSKIQKEFNKFKDNVTGSEDVFNSVWENINTGAEKTILLEDRLTDKTTHAYELAEKLKGINDFELEDIDFDSSNLSDKQQAFVDLANSLGLNQEETGELINKLVELDYAINNTSNQTKEATEAVSEWNEETKKAELKKFGIDETDFEKYLNVFRELNPELAEFEEKCEQAAIEQYAFDQAVEDLRSHLNDYVENLETLDETSVEYANSIQSIASDLTALTGVDFSITDAQTFMQDKTNLDLLRQALDGDNAALDRLRANASRTIVANIVANTQIDTDEFWQQYNELVNWMIANPNIGTLEAKSYLDESPFVQSCLRMIAQGKMTAEQLQAIFAAQGWDFKYDTKTVDVWLSGGSVPKNKTGMAGDLGIGAGAGRYSLHKETITVPTNIRYERKNSGRTAPSITKPTSSSGANYKPEQKTGSGGGGGGGGSSPKSTDEKKEEKDPTEEAKEEEEELEDTYDEFFDYFERRLKVISDAISLLDANLENVVGSKAKNTLLDAQMRIYKMQQDEYAGAQDMYQEMADRALAKIDDSDIVEKIKNGAVAIDEFIGKGNEEVVEAINDYTKWADKVADCKQQLAELREEIRQLELTKMKNILQDWQDVFDLRQSNAIDLIDKQIDLIEETGNLVGKAFYEQQRSQTEGQLRAMEQARRELSDELNRGLSNGTIEIGSDEWLEEVGLLQEVEGQILDCKKAIEEYDNAILNIHTEVFERIQDQFDNLDSEISDLVSLLEDAEPGDDFGNWTKEGIAQAGLLAQQYELANKQTKSLSEEIDYLNSQYNSGKYSTTEYTERLADLTSQQRSSAKAAEDAKKSLISLNKARIDIEITAIQKDIEQYKKLIDVQKQSLQSQKDLHDYEKNIAGQNRNISDIERRLAVMSGDNTASTIAKRKALEKELSDARMELEESEYSHSIEAQQEALDQQATQYEESRQAEIDKLNEYLENETQVLSDTFEAVKARALEIGQTIAQTAQEHGIQVSESLTAAWKAGSDAIASYGEVLTPATSEFIAQLEDVEEHTWELQEQADVTSVQLAAMFANRADNLVDELQRSWDSEANLNEMTKALEDSFVHTIDTAGHIGEIVASNMAEAEAATDAVKDAAESAADAFNDMADSASAAGSAARSAINDLNALEAKANDSSWKSGTAYEPPYKTHYTSVYNAPYSGVQWDSIGGHYKKKAKGLRKADHNELMWTQELGDEVIVSPTRNSILTPIKAGDSVLTAGMTKNLWELAKVDPKQLLDGNGANISAPQIQSNNSSVQIGTLVNVEGSISDDNLTDVKQTIQEELKKTFRNINSGLLR